MRDSFVRPSARFVLMIAVATWLSVRPGLAQVTLAAGSTPPDDTPSIKVGATIFADYTYNSAPETTDADGNTINLSAFNVTRTYINVTGSISHLIAFRITPDITRETGAGSTAAGSLVFRLKYGYAQINLDDWMTRGSWVRLGIQQTPWVDFQENIYRYRFQGTVFSEREGFLSSSDAGASFHYNLPSNYGDVHVGYYNGDTYTSVETNDQKAFQLRGSVRPLPAGALVFRGLRAHLFYDADHYVRNGERYRLIPSVTFEHQYLNAGYEYMATEDQTLISNADVKGRGYSVWATPRSTMGFEGLLRYDHFTPDTSVSRRVRKRTILGIAYWFPHQGSVASAFLLDYDSATFDNFAPALAKQTKVAVHGLVSF